MTCRKCGNILMEGAKFCTVCGSAAESAAAPVAPPVATYASTTATYAATPAAPTMSAMTSGAMLGSSPRATALSVLKNPITLITGILWLVLSVLLFKPVVELFEMFEYFDEMNLEIDFEITMSCFVLVLLLAQTLVCGIGFIMAFAKARQNQLGGTGAIKGGFVITFMIFAIVTLFIIMVIAEAADRYSGMGYYGYRESSFVSENAVELILVFGSIVLLFVSIAQFISSFTIVEIAVRNDRSYKKTSVFAAVVSFLAAALLLYIMTETGVMDAKGDEATMITFGFLCSIAICILLGIMVIMFGKIGMPVAAPASAFSTPVASASTAPFTVPTTAASTTFGASTTQNTYGQGVNNGYQQPIPDLNVGYQQPVPDLNVGYQQPIPDLNVGYQQPVPDLNVSYQQQVQNATPNYQQPVQQVSVEQPVQPENVTVQAPVSQVDTTGFQMAAGLAEDDNQAAQKTEVENRIPVQTVQESAQNSDSEIPMN